MEYIDLSLLFPNNEMTRAIYSSELKSRSYSARRSRSCFLDILPHVSMAQPLDISNALRECGNLAPHFCPVIEDRDILLEHSPDDLVTCTPERVLEGIAKMRSGDIAIEPGYDGVYGKVEIPFGGSR
ncbi:hypothetical protein ACFLSG_04295 [Candidatus Bipolaricaulota bacterium]